MKMGIMEELLIGGIVKCIRENLGGDTINNAKAVMPGPRHKDLRHLQEIPVASEKREDIRECGLCDKMAPVL